MSGYRTSFDDYKTIKCEIRCDGYMKRAVDKNGLVGTINVFYGSDAGNAFSFKF